MASGLTLDLIPEYQTLPYNTRKGFFIVRVTPPLTPQDRPPIRMVLALDVSGSMSGTKLTSAILSAQTTIKALSSIDYFSCVTFDDRIKVILPMTQMDAYGKQLARQILSNVKAGRNTNISDAILTSFKLCEGKGHVLLLTDGCPNDGVVDPDQLLNLVAGAAGGATLSAFGFGRDVNPMLLSSIAERGRGNYTFIETGEPPMEAIAAEVGGLMKAVAANFQLVLRPSAGVQIEKVLRFNDVHQSEGQVVLSLSSLIGEEDIMLPIFLHWNESAIEGAILTATAQAYSTSDGSPLQASIELVPRFAEVRGAIQPKAAREILLGHIAEALHVASQATDLSKFILAEELQKSYSKLFNYAKEANISDDLQVESALQILNETSRELADGDEKTTRQDMFATSTMLSKKRSTISGTRNRQTDQAFKTKSQLFGIDLFKNMESDDEDDKS